ncbi:hypothetical protein P3T43_004274 [Paraburkholderia sp. GAS41]|jgi:hypothetical protein
MGESGGCDGLAAPAAAAIETAYASEFNPRRAAFRPALTGKTADPVHLRGGCGIVQREDRRQAREEP